MYLLIHAQTRYTEGAEPNLHPTMYLLIPVVLALMLFLMLFTSHYVSINSRNY